jgi:chemotaxis protein CheD
MKKISVGIADLQIARAPAVLVSYGLGSCIGIALYDPYRKIGGLAHVMLPAQADGKRTEDSLKYADTAVEATVSRMLEAGCARGALLAKMAGGADMFPARDAQDPNGPARPRIGERNAQAVRAKLEEMGIPLVAEDVGGNYGRTVELDPATGDLRVRSVRRGCKVL